MSKTQDQSNHIYQSEQTLTSSLFNQWELEVLASNLIEAQENASACQVAIASIFTFD